MSSRFHSTRARVGAVAIAALTVSGVAVGTAVAGGNGETKKENWSVIDRNTVGSPVAALRDGPSSAVFTQSGQPTAPPFGKGSLGIEVADKSTSLSPPSEHAAFGDQVDFAGDSVLDLTAVGFYVFQTQENVDHGGPRNMPNITFEIDPNLSSSPSNYTSMVWVPDAAPVVNEWSGYIDATTSGNWYFTGAAGTATACTDALNCNFAQAMAALNDGGDVPVIKTVAIAKGRDNLWSGAVDGLRINNKTYDFESDGVKTKGAK